MDYTTSHIFFLVSLALFSTVLFALSLVDRSVVGARWLVASTSLDFIKTLLQGLNGYASRLVTVCVANELNVLAFVAMFLGLRWFVVRRPFREWRWLAPVAVVLAVYPLMFLARMRLWSFTVISLPVLGLCAAAAWALWRQKSERFLVPARLTAGLLAVHIAAVSYRCVLSLSGHSAASVASPWGDRRWMYSMLVIMLVCYCVLLMYALFTMLEIHANVAHAAGVDALTGALNRRALVQHAGRKLEQSERLGRSLAVVCIDLDNFKRVNDTYGHAGGDVALCAFVDLVKEQLRPDDMVARLGGEEFALVLPDTDAAGAAHLAERLRHSLEQMRVHYDGRMIVTTASAGVTERQPGDALAAMLKRADAALYRAKAEGRNCVMVDEQVLHHAKPVLVERMAAQRQPGKTA